MNEEAELILKKLKIVSESEEPGAYICDKEHSKILLKEIERLNNTTTELEKILEEERKKDRPRDDYNYGVGNTLDYIWYKLQELKGDNSNNRTREQVIANEDRLIEEINKQAKVIQWYEKENRHNQEIIIKDSKELERLRKTVAFLTDEYNKKKAARNYVIANAELFDDFICTGNNFEMSDLLEIFDIGDKKC